MRSAHRQLGEPHAGSRPRWRWRGAARNDRRLADAARTERSAGDGFSTDDGLDVRQVAA